MEKMVLLVDDDQIFNWVLTKMIQKLDTHLTVDSFLDGKKALDFLQSDYNGEHFYHIFLDINMPVLNGWRFLDALESMGSIKSESISIYIVSSSTDKIDQEKAGLYPLVQGFISKPLSIDQVRTILET